MNPLNSLVSFYLNVPPSKWHKQMPHFLRAKEVPSGTFPDSALISGKMKLLK
jgi:hypothetical protein